MELTKQASRFSWADLMFWLFLLIMFSWGVLIGAIMIAQDQMNMPKVIGSLIGIGFVIIFLRWPRQIWIVHEWSAIKRENHRSRVINHGVEGYQYKHEKLMLEVGIAGLMLPYLWLYAEGVVYLMWLWPARACYSVLKGYVAFRAILHKQP